MDISELRRNRANRQKEEMDRPNAETLSGLNSKGRHSWISKENGLSIENALDALREDLHRLDVGQGYFGSGRNDGVLSQNEILQGLKKASNGTISDEQLKSAKAMLPKEGLAIEDLVRVMKTSLNEEDRDKNGIISPKEMPKQVSDLLNNLPSR